MKKTESGSAHAVIIGVLTVALVAAVGTLFWQNIINKQTQDSTTTATKSTSPSPSVAALKSYCAPLEKLCFDYPSNWTVKSENVNADNDSVAEKIIISNETGKPELLLQTGMSGIGGACGPSEDGSYAKVIQTHTTAITGSYLVNEAAKAFESSTTYAASWISYNGTDKNWTIDMGLNNNKPMQAVGKIGSCDVGLGIISGKNAAWSSSTTEPGAVSFGLYHAGSTIPKYGTEAEATAALNSTDGKNAYAVLQSAHYE